ncbi:MAG: hypothetical protein LBS53_00135 [Synergistaceae bacterium]|jgi:hypothetical protein|nr:hypothetical protein [Synergistaceae bacterium]
MDMNDWDKGKLQGALVDIRATESPGRKSDVSSYARAVYACFDDIQALTSEGFTLSTICNFLEKKGALPAGADTRSFCRALRRERARREQAEKQKISKTRRAVKNDDTVKSEETTVTKEGTGLPAPAYRTQAKPDGGPRLNPGNTFKIEPVNLDILPDFESLTKQTKQMKIERCENN